MGKTYITTGKKKYTLCCQAVGGAGKTLLCFLRFPGCLFDSPSVTFCKLNVFTTHKSTLADALLS